MAEVIETRIMFENSPYAEKARNGDPLALYPIWHIQLRLDKLYPSNIYGLDFGILADTKEVYEVQVMIRFGI
jgi:hypothetical protein